MSAPATSMTDAPPEPPSRVEDVCALAHIPEAVSAVRRRTRDILVQWGVPTPTADDALLVISELATNAIVHALELTDAGPAPRRRPTHDDPQPAEHRENGRGADIVAALSARHGISRHPERTTRWAVLHMGA